MGFSRFALHVTCFCPARGKAYTNQVSVSYHVSKKNLRNSFRFLDHFLVKRICSSLVVSIEMTSVAMVHFKPHAPNISNVWMLWWCLIDCHVNINQNKEKHSVRVVVLESVIFRVWVYLSQFVKGRNRCWLAWCLNFSDVARDHY